MRQKNNWTKSSSFTGLDADSMDSVKHGMTCLLPLWLREQQYPIGLHLLLEEASDVPPLQCSQDPKMMD